MPPMWKKQSQSVAAPGLDAKVAIEHISSPLQLRKVTSSSKSNGGCEYVVGDSDLQSTWSILTSSHDYSSRASIATECGRSSTEILEDCILVCACNIHASSLLKPCQWQ